jgi:RsiW-degrading membrane proteinase PrsW (M82 family)
VNLSLTVGKNIVLRFITKSSFPSPKMAHIIFLVTIFLLVKLTRCFVSEKYIRAPPKNLIAGILFLSMYSMVVVVIINCGRCCSKLDLIIII